MFLSKQINKETRVLCKQNFVLNLNYWDYYDYLFLTTVGSY
jgi:hypothetical protein